jgi:DNA-binding SARP family transcriptional activator/tetratricopeptide (TPR) repeat protein
MEFCLLGPLAVRRNGTDVPVSAGKQRAVLAALLLYANRVLPMDELAEALWGSAPPASARVTVQNHVARLRRTLGAAGQSRISTRPSGYLIQADADELDVSRFEALLHSARAATREGSWATAAAHAATALALWRGEPLAETGQEVLAARELPRLVEMRWQAVGTRIDAELHLGHEADVIAELQQLVSAHPLREHLHGQRMLALYRDGRPGEALAAYRQARKVLIGELGTEPGAELQELQQRILAADPALARSAPARSAETGPGPVVPRQLPAPVAHFSGRADELAALTGLLDRAGTAAEPVAISVIRGTAGVGKTALAVQWAHQVAERFPDGQLYVNLRGYDPDQPMTAADALAGLLRALDVPGPDIPAEEAERASRYRSLLAGRRMLVVADNAGSVEQARPLLPGSPGCAAVVTSRDSLAGLVARDGAERLDLDLLPPHDAVGLLHALIGSRADADASAVTELAAQCCGLPLALRVAAELVVARARTSVADLVDELADQRRRLDLLDADGDQRTAVRAVFSWSYRHLAADAARAFWLAGLHPGPDLDPYALAALTGTTLGQTARLLDVLARGSLVQSAGSGRYGMHDLLRAYALERATAEASEDERRLALTRLFDYYLGTAAAAMDTLFPGESHRRPRIPLPGTPSPEVTGTAAARAWLDAERTTLVDVAAYTAAHGWPSHTARLGATVFRYLEAAGHYPEINALHGQALHAARNTSDRAAEARALHDLSAVDLRQGRSQQATEHLQYALTVCRQTGDRAGAARALGNLGIANFLRDRYEKATSHYQQALAVYQEIGDESGEGRTLNNFSLVELRQGRYEQASGHLDRALALSRKTGNRTIEAYALGNLGALNVRLGRYQQASEYLDQALALCRKTGAPDSEANALSYLGVLDLRLGRHQQARDHLDQALALYRKIGDHSSEAEALNALGEVRLATGQPGEARQNHAAALSLARRMGNKYEQARACEGLGHACHALTDPGPARHYWQQALALYTELGTPEADQVRAQLASR